MRNQKKNLLADSSLIKIVGGKKRKRRSSQVASAHSAGRAYGKLAVNLIRGALYFFK